MIEASVIQAWATMATALGVGALIPKALALLRNVLTGRGTRERAEIDRLRTEAEAMRLHRDDEAALRREWQEHASEIRTLALAHGATTKELPAPPGRKG